jgi:hypothetical protein
LCQLLQITITEKQNDMKRYPFLMAAMVTLQGLHGQNHAGTTQLSAFAGKYQFTDNKMTFLQISTQDSGLLLKQLWDNQQISFKRTGALTFYNDERSFPLAFTKDSLGRVTQVLAFDRDLWKKVPDNYQPELQRIVKLSPQQLKACEGKYQLQGGDGDVFLTIATADSHLVLTQLWNQQQINLWPVAALEFFNDNQNFPVKFIPDANGVINQLVANGRDKWMMVK